MGYMYDTYLTVQVVNSCPMEFILEFTGIDYYAALELSTGDEWRIINDIIKETDRKEISTFLGMDGGVGLI